jgi:hypothetical protein
MSESVILGADGKAARKPKSDKCPMCGAGPELRTGTGGFGGPKHPVCISGRCSPAYEWKDEVWDE